MLVGERVGCPDAVRLKLLLLLGTAWAVRDAAEQAIMEQEIMEQEKTAGVRRHFF